MPPPPGTQRVKKSHFQGLIKSKNGHKIFLQDTFDFVLDKNYFVHVEGQGIGNYLL